MKNDKYEGNSQMSTAALCLEILAIKKLTVSEFEFLVYVLILSGRFFFLKILIPQNIN